MVILGYLPALHVVHTALMGHYCEMALVSKVLFVWNAPGAVAPTETNFRGMQHRDRARHCELSGEQISVPQRYRRGSSAAGTRRCRSGGENGRRFVRAMEAHCRSHSRRRK